MADAGPPSQNTISSTSWLARAKPLRKEYADPINPAQTEHVLDEDYLWPGCHFFHSVGAPDGAWAINLLERGTTAGHPCCYQRKWQCSTLGTPEENGDGEQCRLSAPNGCRFCMFQGSNCHERGYGAAHDAQYPIIDAQPTSSFSSCIDHW